MIILNLLLRYYKGQFSRIWIFSPSIKLDPQYAPLRKLLEKMTDQNKSRRYSRIWTRRSWVISWTSSGS